MRDDAATHLTRECGRLDLLLHRQILRLRASYQLSLDEFRGLYISNEQVDALVSRSAAKAARDNETVSALTGRAEALRAELNQRRDPTLPWARLASAYHLSEFEQDTLLLAIAPQLDLKYETILAYLNNDVTRKWPTRDLALRLFTGPHDESVRELIGPEAPLFQNGLLRLISAGDSHSWLAAGFAAAPWVLPHLLGSPEVPGAVTGIGALRPSRAMWDTLPLSKAERDRLRTLPRLFRKQQPEYQPPILLLEGRPGSGRGAVAEALCHELCIPLIAVDLSRCQLGGEGVQSLVQEIALYQRMVGAALLLYHADCLTRQNGEAPPDRIGAFRHLEHVVAPIMIACEEETAPCRLIPGRRTLLVRLTDPDFHTRRSHWQSLLAREEREVSDEALTAVADRFVLTPGRIALAVASALDQIVLTVRNGSPLDQKALMEAARSVADGSLGRSAVKVRLIHAWDDLVLPGHTLRQLKDITQAIRHHHVVYDAWGFGRRLSGGQGVKILFAGASGTGKSMSASVIAREAGGGEVDLQGRGGIDLYKVDLSGVVSKYIGETEKNLDGIFRAAREANAMVFFDEADALFGKRSEVKDAHDRYANIEVAYLLQKMEEHDGIVILATNLSRNLDQAFSRRMQYVVEFPMPDAAQRERLWRRMLPSEVPLADDVDFGFLAEQFILSGGDVRNVALDAAFLAAGDGRVVTMAHLINAVARQMLKQGKSPAPGDFRQYYPLVAADPELRAPPAVHGRA